MFLEMVKTILESAWLTFKAFIDAVFQLLPIYQTLSEFKNQMVACILGVPVVIISIAKVCISVVRFFRRVNYE